MLSEGFIYRNRDRFHELAGFTSEGIAKQYFSMVRAI